MLLRFANFHCRFIQDFSRIAVLSITMLKTIVNDPSAKKLVSINEDSTFKKVGGDDNDEIDIANIRSSQSKTAKSKNMIQLKKPETKICTLRVELAFAKLR